MRPDASVEGGAGAGVPDADVMPKTSRVIIKNLPQYATETTLLDRLKKWNAGAVTDCKVLKTADGRSRRIAVAPTYLAEQLGCHEASLLKVCLEALTGDRDHQPGGALVVSRRRATGGLCPRFRLGVGPGNVVFVALSHADAAHAQFTWGRQVRGTRHRRRNRRG